MAQRDRSATTAGEPAQDGDRALPRAGCTGVGSLPGDDIDAALALALDAAPELPWLPELPARGPGSDLLGRTLAAVYAATGDLAFDRQPAGWRLVHRPGIDARAAVDRLTADLDALLPFADLDSAFKTQLAGPWTVAAGVELSRGGRALHDPGAVREIAAGLAEAAAVHLAGVRERMPAAAVVLQIDEPSLPAVLAGSLPTESGFGRLAAVPEPDAVAALAAVVAAAAAPVVMHCCAGDPPLALFADAGAAAVSWDATALTAGHRRRTPGVVPRVDTAGAPGVVPRVDTAGAPGVVPRVDEDLIGTLVERGVRLWPGVVPALGPGVAPPPAAVTDPVRRLWRSLGFAPERLAETVTLTPACGLAGASQGWAREAFRVLRQAARALSEAPEKIDR